MSDIHTPHPRKASRQVLSPRDTNNGTSKWIWFHFVAPEAWKVNIWISCLYFPYSFVLGRKNKSSSNPNGDTTYKAMADMGAAITHMCNFIYFLLLCF